MHRGLCPPSSRAHTHTPCTHTYTNPAHTTYHTHTPHTECTHTTLRTQHHTTHTPYRTHTHPTHTRHIIYTPHTQYIHTTLHIHTACATHTHTHALHTTLNTHASHHARADNLRTKREPSAPWHLLNVLKHGAGVSRMKKGKSAKSTSRD